MIPGSALRKLSDMTGLEAKKLADGCYGLYVTPEVAIFSFLSDEKLACKELREVNLRRVCRIVFEKQEWECLQCGAINKGLSGHHVRFRSRWRRQDGPLDVESNISGLCAGCHQDQHL